MNYATLVTGSNGLVWFGGDAAYSNSACFYRLEGADP